MNNNSTAIKKARRTIAQAFQADPGFRLGYVANVACVLMDHLDIKDAEKRDAIADEIIELIFERQ